MKKIIILVATILVTTIGFGQQTQQKKELQQKSTGQILISKQSEEQRHIQHYEKIMTKYKQGKWKLNKRELQMVLMNLEDLYNEIGDKAKSKQYQKKLNEHESKHPEIKMRDDMRKDTERSIQKHEKKLKEYKKGKRDYRDAYFILQVLSADYNRLRQKSKARKYLKEFEELKLKHPDLISNPPQEMSEQKKAREELERKKEEIKKKPFVPKDNRAVVFKSSNSVALVYQYRIEFYKLPEDVEIYIDSNEDGELRKHELKPFSNRIGYVKFCYKNSVHKIKSKRGYTVPIQVYRATSELKLKPHKVMTFKNGLSVAPLSPSDNQRAILICSYPIPESGYTPSDKEEWDEYFLLRDEWPGKKWTNKNGQYDEFYGVIDIEGNIIGEIPFKVHFPDSVIQPLNVSNDGTKAVLVIARWGPEPEDGINTFVDYREYLLWEYPNKVKKMTILDSGIKVYKARGSLIWRLFEEKKRK